MKIKNILVLIGPPGSGKGTQGKLLSDKLKYNYLSLGQTLREFSKDGTERGRQIGNAIDNGHIIPDEWIRQIFFDKLKALPKADGLILDGFPRDINQVPILLEAVEKYQTEKVKAIFIDVPKFKILDRLKKRGEIESRADDDPEVIETRFREYDAKTFPLVEYFEKKHSLTSIHGDQSVEQVHHEIMRKMRHA